MMIALRNQHSERSRKEKIEKEVNSRGENDTVDHTSPVSLQGTLDRLLLLAVDSLGSIVDILVVIGSNDLFLASGSGFDVLCVVIALDILLVFGCGLIGLVVESRHLSSYGACVDGDARS